MWDDDVMLYNMVRYINLNWGNIWIGEIMMRWCNVLS